MGFSVENTNLVRDVFLGYADDANGGKAGAEKFIFRELRKNILVTIFRYLQLIQPYR